jgi:hypothetical protein
MNKLTLNNIIDVFKQVADSHEQINTFYSGSIEDFKKLNLLYPVLYLNIDDCFIRNNEMQYTCNVILLDRVQKDLSNRDEVFSDLLQIASDIKIYLQGQNATTFPLIIEPEAQVFKTNFQSNSDYALGWNLQLKVRSKYNNSPCQIPFATALTPFYGSSSNGSNSSSSQFLTCSNVLSCSTLTDYISSHSTTPAYSVYTALLNQSGSTSPVATVLDNSIGAITYSRIGIGEYVLSYSGFTNANKIFCIATNNLANGNGDFTTSLGWMNTGHLYMAVYSQSDLTDDWNYLQAEIRIYN